MQIVENVDNVDNFEGEGAKVGKTVFWFMELDKKISTNFKNNIFKKFVDIVDSYF